MLQEQHPQGWGSPIVVAQARRRRGGACRAGGAAKDGRMLAVITPSFSAPLVPPRVRCVAAHCSRHCSLLPALLQTGEDRRCSSADPLRVQPKGGAGAHPQDQRTQAGAAQGGQSCIQSRGRGAGRARGVRRKRGRGTLPRCAGCAALLHTHPGTHPLFALSPFSPVPPCKSRYVRLLHHPIAAVLSRHLTDFTSVAHACVEACPAAVGRPFGQLPFMFPGVCALQSCCSWCVCVCVCS